MSFTYTSILHQRQILSCCSTMKSSLYIDKLKNGEKCDQLLTDSMLMRNLLIVLKDYIPVGDFIIGEQAGVIFGPPNGATKDGGTVTITINTPTPVIYTTTFTNMNPTNFAIFIVDYINSLYPNNYPYTATIHPIVVTRFIIYGTDFDASNGIVVDLEIISINPTYTDQKIFSAGTTPVYRLESDNCLTNLEAEIILNKLSELCSTPCEDIVNFN